MLLLDDRPIRSQMPGLHPCPETERVHLVGFPSRFPSIGAKYDAGISWAKSAGIEFNAISIWDGDDSFLPRHLELSARVLEQYDWCYPSVIFSTMTGVLRTEPTETRRCWSSCSFRRSLLDSIGGFQDDPQVAFDQNTVARLRAIAGEPGDTGVPTYVYRWSDTGSDHASGHSDGAADTKWYKRVPIAKQRGTLYPMLDDATLNIFSQAKERFPEYLA